LAKRITQIDIISHLHFYKYIIIIDNIQFMSVILRAESDVKVV